MSNVANIKIKTHRHYVPVFKGTLPDIAAVRRFSAALSRHDWNRNPHIYQLRCERNQRVSVRSERRETWYALALAMIANADYNPDSEALFEVMCPVETLASQCGQLHLYESGRKSYDPILHALHDWESANLIIIHRDFDREAKQYKAMRIWLRPEFFAGLGFSLVALRDIVTRFRRWMERKGLREEYQKRYARHVLRLSRSNVASLDNRHALKNLLKKLRHLVTGDDETLEREKKHLEKALKQKKAQLQASRPKEDEPGEAWRLYERWKQIQPVAVVRRLEQRIKSLYPTLRGELLYQCYLDNLPDN
ncbi:RepA family replication protein [Morganella morganii]